MLCVEDVVVRFGGLLALDSVSFQAEAGQITGLIGPNGAGKTTLFNVLTGLQRVAGGTVTLAGRDITTAGVRSRFRLGMARTYQRLELFTSLSVRDNVLTSAEVAGNRKASGSLTDELLDFVGLSGQAEQLCSTLPTGSARLLEVARALASRPRLLLVDEPAAGLTEPETERLGSVLRATASEGAAVILIEHDMRLVMGVSDSLVVFDSGRVLAKGEPADVAADERVLAAYLGSSPGGRA